jgi:hypothetical protein
MMPMGAYSGVASLLRTLTKGPGADQIDRRS